jgi:oligopeptide/dipeptide ABC transporter ATP-binding protein
LKDVVLRAVNLTKSYFGPGGTVHALRGISLELQKGRTLAVVGESGCGKSTLARILVGLEAPDSGETSKTSLVPMVFQDSLGSLHPRRRVRQLIVEPLLIRDRKIKMSFSHERRAEELARQVGLPLEYLDSFAHELSGGQRQRVNIARALSLDPSVLVLDEPVSALDVSIQAQILNLLIDLQNEKNLAVLFISHDLSIVRHLAHEVHVLYLGQVVETGPAEKVLRKPLHPYTQALLASDPSLLQTVGRAPSGEPPSPYEVLVGCAYADRCSNFETACSAKPPRLQTVSSRGERVQAVACFPLQRAHQEKHANESASL